MYTAGFLLFLLLTLVAAALTLASGIARRRRVHVVRALTTVGLLVVTVVLAFRMLGERTFPAAEMRIHRVFSMSVAALVPLVAVTGILLWNRPSWRIAHRVCVALFLLAAVGAAVTGTWVLWLSTPK